MRGKALSFLVSFALALGFAGSLRAAEVWRGPSSLEVQIQDSSGKPVEGAQVRLLYQALEPKTGPNPVSTDDKGEAYFFSLAEGWWALEVTKEGALTIHSEFVLSGEKKPAVLSTFQENTPGASQTLQVRIGRPRPGRSAGATAGGPQVVPKPAAVPPPTSPPATPPVPAEPIAPPTPEPTPIQAAAPTPPPSPVPVSPPPAEPIPLKLPEPTPVPLPVSPPPTPPTPAPSVTAPPVPAPAPAPVPEAIPAPAPAPVPAPALPEPKAQRRSYAERSCIECKAGEEALSIEIAVPPGSAPCGDGLDSRLRERDPAKAETGLPPSCQLLRITLPPEARFTGYRFEVEDGGASRDCRAGADCPLGTCRFPLDPGIRKGPTGTTFTAAFENTSPDRERRAIFTVYFAPGG